MALIKSRILEHYKDATTALNHTNAYELLVAVMLSAQCTDERVNLVTPKLFKAYPDTKALASADVDSIRELIKSINFFNNKAKHLKEMALKVESEFGGKIPSTQKELMSLSGVGQKTANVILGELLGTNVMAVDTHVFRVAHRLNLSQAKTPLETEKDLSDIFKTNLNSLHQGMVLFGRHICKARTPLCALCFLQDLCTSPLKRT
ncbi:endonuclease III [Helicobacter sp. 11S02629-2]|uniref:endonuclease III n=1 Tax=Helicobacter sp. 11S02629-2 TaxID=1476195 RepID=UPI000BA50F2B|nr:endonuclease III [Helicobacter sp. 11S02629-2]PAF44664.1 endonuclease III [Helicobacter sp. 11S02629-2]